MSKLVELQRKEKELLVELRALGDKEGISTEDFKIQLDKINGDLEMTRSKIKIAEQMETEDQAAANAEGLRRERANRESEESKVKKRYSIVRAIQIVAGGKSLDGIEAEMAQEAVKEARAAGLAMEGNLQIPSMLIRDNAEKRTTMVAGTASVGGNAIATELSSDVIPFLNPQLQTEALGATVLTGLVGNLDIPRKNTRGSAVWASEVASATETNPTISLVQLRPKRLTAFTPISKTLMAQNAFSVESMVRMDLNEAIQIAWDAAAINGTGSSNQPTGILNVAGIGSVVGGTNGLAPTWANIVALETELAVDNANAGTLAYLTTPGIRGKLKSTEKFSSTGMTVWGTNEMNGYTAAVSTQVPSTLTKGTSSGVCHAILFANWRELILAQWAGLDIVVDPYTRAKEALIELIVNAWVDVGVRHPESFAAMKDALIS